MEDNATFYIIFFQRIKFTESEDIKDRMWNKELSFSPKFHFHFR